MKLNKVLLIAAVFVGGMLTSCNDDGYWNAASDAELGQANGSTYSFNSSESSFVYEPEDILAGKDINITIHRGTSKGTATIPIKATFADATLLSGAESVTFDEGSTTATYSIHFNKELTPGSYTSATLVLDTLSLGIEKVPAPDRSKLATKNAEDSATYVKDSISYSTYLKKLANYKLVTSINIEKKTRWDVIGSCTFVDYTFSESGQSALNVPIEQAVGTNRYRIVQPYFAVYGGPNVEGGFVSDTGIGFTLNSDNSITLSTDSKGYVTVLNNGTNEYIFAWVAKYVPSHCNVVSDGNIYQATMLGIISGEGYYTGFSFAFQWTEGWPGK